MSSTLGSLVDAAGVSDAPAGGLPPIVVEALFRQPERHSMETLDWLFADETIHRLNGVAQGRQKDADGVTHCPVCLAAIDDHDGRVGAFWRDYPARDQVASVSVRRLEAMFCLCSACAPLLLDAGGADVIQAGGEKLKTRIGWLMRHFGLDDAGAEGWLQAQAAAEVLRTKVEWCFDFTMEASANYQDFVVLDGWSAEASKRLTWVTDSVKMAIWVTGTKFIGARRNIDPPAPGEFYVDCDLKPKAMGG